MWVDSEQDNLKFAKIVSCILTRKQLKEIEANAEQIMDSIERTGEHWASSSPAERMIAASACPKALYAELQEQLSKHDEFHNEDYAEFYALKTSSKSKSSTEKKPVISKPTKSESTTPSI